MICEGSELLVDGAGWVSVENCNLLPCATLAGGNDVYLFTPVNVAARNRRATWRFTRFNFDICACGELPLISRATAEAGESRVLPVRGEELSRAIGEYGRSAHNVLRVVEPETPHGIDLNEVACWVFGIGQPLGVTTVHCSPERAKLFLQLAGSVGEHQPRRYTDDQVKFFRPQLPWWTMSFHDRQTVYRLALLLYGRPGFYGARIEGCTIGDFDALQWCATASGAHARLDAQGTCWLTRDRGNPAILQSMTVDRRLSTAFEVSAHGEVIITRWRGEISAQFLSMD